MEIRNTQMAVQLGTCIATCNHCLDACLGEDDVKMMARCIKLDKECAEICAMTLSQLSSNGDFTAKVLDLCAEACGKCAAECRKHDYEHCRECAAECEKCAESCRSYKA